MTHMSQKPIIGVMPLWDDDKKSIWMLPGYTEGISEHGGMPIIFPLTDNMDDILLLCKMCDGFLLTGGHDVNPAVYGETRSDKVTEICEVRDLMEETVLKYAIEFDKPLLGICRGIQFINASLGGTLYQDLESERPGKIDHHMNPPYDRVAHMVNIKEDSPLYETVRTKSMGVNSYHHQAIKKLSDSLEIMAVSEDGLVEAVYMPGKKFIWALQWHPEYNYKVDENSRKIFEHFLHEGRF